MISVSFRLFVITFSALLASYFLCGAESVVSSSSSHSISVDSHASSDHQASISEYVGNIPIINIAPPNKSGVSHNLFSNYHVGPEGVIYNNNATINPIPGQPFLVSYLAGIPLWPNENLHGRAADLILTEVTGCDTSILEGITEIYGSSASYILVNPNGIYCNGAGFINARSVTLSTGCPVFDRYGMLRSLQVRKGTIEVQGSGITAYSLDNISTPIDLLSRVAKISGHLWTKGAVGIYTGLNELSYQTHSLTKLEDASSAPPCVSIDASLLGKVSAGKISLVSTEKGVGMNCPTLLTNSDNIAISADGTITLRGDIQSDQSIFIESKTGDILQENSSNKLFSKGNISFSSPSGKISLVNGKRFTNNGTISLKGKDLYTGPRVYLNGCNEKGFNGKIDISISRNIRNEGVIKLPYLKHRFSDFHNSGTLQTKNGLSLELDAIFNKGVINNGTKEATLKVVRSIKNEGIISSDGILSFSGGSFDNIQSGTVCGKEGVFLFSHSDVINKGAIRSSHGAVSIDCKGNVSNMHSLFGSSGLTITALSLSNEGQLRSEGKIDLTIDNQITNILGVWSGGDLTLSVSNLTNGLPMFRSVDGPSIDPTPSFIPNGIDEVNSQRGNLPDSTSNSDKLGIIGSGDIFIKSHDFTNKGQGILSAKKVLSIRSSDSLENYGVLRAITDSIGISSDDFLNGGLVSSPEQLSIDANHQLFNEGILQAGYGDILLHTKGSFKSTHTIRSGGSLTVAANSFVNSGKLSSAKRLLCRVDQNFENSQQMSSQGNILISSGPFHNGVSGCISAGQDLVVSAINNITNFGNLNSKQKSVEVITDRFLENESCILSSGDLLLKSGQLTNGKSGQIYAQKDLSITTPGGFHNQGTLSSGEGAIALKIGKTLLTNKVIQSKSCLDVEADTVINKKDIISGSDLLIEGSRVGNDINGQIISKQSMHIGLIDQMVNHGNIQTHSGPLHLVVKNHLFTTHKLSSGYSLSLQAHSCINKGSICSKKDSTIELVGSLENTNKIVSSTNMCIVSDQMTNGSDGKITAQDMLTIRSKSSLHNEGLIATKRSDLALTVKELVTSGKLHSGRSIALNIADDLINRGPIYASSHLQVKAGQHVENTSSIVSKGGLSISSGTFLNSTPAILFSESNLDLHLQGSLINKGLVKSTRNNIAIISSEDVTNQGKIYSGLKTSIRSSDLFNTKVICSVDALSLQAINNLTNQGSLESVDGSVALDVGKSLVTTGIVRSGRLLQLSADTFTNRGTITSGKEALCLVKDHFKNYAFISTTQGPLSIHILENGGIYNYRQGRITSQNGLLMDRASKIVNDGVIENHKGLLSLFSLGPTVNSKQIISRGKLVITGGSLKNSQSIASIEDLSLKISDNLNNQHNIFSKSGIDITACDLINGVNGSIQCGNQLTIDSRSNFANLGNLVSSSGGIALHAGKNFSSSGQIGSPHLLSIHSSRFRNSGLVIGQEEVTLSIEESATNKGTISGVGTLKMTSGDFTNHSRGKVASDHIFILASKGSLTNDGSLFGQEVVITATGSVVTRNIIASKSTLSLQTNSLFNSGKMHTPETLTMVSKESTTNHGVMRSINGQATITASQLENGADGIITSEDALCLTTQIDCTNRGLVQGNGLSITVGGLLCNHDRLLSNANMSIQTGSLSNTIPGKITTPTNLSVLARDSCTNSGFLTSKTMQLASAQSFTNEGTIDAADALVVKSGSLDNNGAITGGSVNFSITTQSAFCNSGTIKSVAKGIFHSDGSFINRHTIASDASLSIDVHSIDNSGSITTPKSCTISGVTLTNLQDGKMQSKEDFSFLIQEKIDNQGSILSEHELQCNVKHLSNGGKMVGNALSMRVGESFDNRGNISGDKGLRLITKEAVNAGHIFGSSRSFDIEAKCFVNEGIITSKGGSSIMKLSSMLDNRGIIESNGSLSIDASDSRNTKCLYGSSDLCISGRSFCNGSSGKILTHGDINFQLENRFDNSSMGQILSEGSIKIVHRTYKNGSISYFSNRNLIHASQSVFIRSNQFSNRGEVIGTNSNLDTDSIPSLGKLMASDTLRLNVKGSGDLMHQGGLVGRNIYLDLKGAFFNRSVLQTRGNLHIQSKKLENDQKIMAGENLVCRSSTNFLNHIGYIYARSSINIKAPESIKNFEGAIYSGGNMVLDSKSISNYGEEVGDIVAKAEACNEPTKYTTPQSGWVKVSTKYTTPQSGWFKVHSSGNGNEANRHTFTKVKRTKIISDFDIRVPAVIHARGNLSFPCQHGFVHNYGSSIAADGDIYSHSAIHNETPSKEIVLPEESIYEKKWTVCIKKEVGFWEGLGKAILTPFMLVSDAASAIPAAIITGSVGHGTRMLYSPDYDYYPNEQRYRQPVTYRGYTPTIAQIYAGGRVICHKGVTNGPSSTQNDSYLSGNVPNFSDTYMPSMYGIRHTITEPSNPFTSVPSASSYTRADSTNQSIHSLRTGYIGLSYIPSIFSSLRSFLFDVDSPLSHQAQVGDRDFSFTDYERRNVYAAAFRMPFPIFGRHDPNGPTHSFNTPHFYGISQEEVPTFFNFTDPKGPGSSFKLAFSKPSSTDRILPDHWQKESVVKDIQRDPPKKSNYYVHTPGELIHHSKYYGSPYLIRKLGLENPSNKFLGDPFFEANCINAQIQKITGQRYLEIASDTEQIRYLMDNTASVYNDLNVALGVRLTPDQIRHLRRDIIWYETQEIKGQQVLAPIVYLCSDTINRVKSRPSLATIYGRSGVSIHDTTATLINTGRIASDGTVDIKVKEVFNYTDVRSGAPAAVIAKDMAIHATDRLVNTSAELTAGGNADIKSKEIRFLNREIKKEEETGWYHRSKHSSGTTKTAITKNNPGRLTIGGHLDMAAESGGITLEGTPIDANSLKVVSRGDVHLVELHDTTTVTSHRSSYSKKGFFIKKVHSERHDSKKVDQTSIGVRFNVKEQMDIHVDGNVTGSGVVLKVGAISGHIGGDCHLKHGTEEHYEEKRDAVSNKKRTLFVFNNDKSETTTSKKGAKKSVASIHTIPGAVSLSIKGAYHGDGVLFDADSIDIRSGKSHTTSLPEETIYDDTTKQVRTYKTGLLGFSYKKGTMGLDIKKETNDFEQVNNTNVHLKQVGYKAKKNISLISQYGKVSSKGIAINSGSILLDGQQGVDTSAAVLNHTTVRSHSSQLSTKCLGITNQFAVAGHKVADIKGLTKNLEAAQENYRQFQTAQSAAKVALDKGEITKKEYDQLSSQRPHHIASITLATAALAAGTTDATRSVVEALPSVTTFGFVNPGLTTSNEHTDTQRNQRSQVVTTSTIQAKDIVVRSDGGSWVASGSKLASEHLNIQTKGVDCSTAQVSESSVTSGSSHSNHTTIGLPTSFSSIKDAIKGICHSTNASINGSKTSGKSSSLSHHTTHIHADHVDMDIAGDINLKGGRIDAKRVMGTITGKLDIETPIDRARSNERTLGVGLSGGLVSNGFSIGISGNIDRKISNQNQFVEQSGILATEHLELKVDKTITNTGGILAASNGKMELSAEDYIAKDRVAISTSNDTILSGTLGGTFGKNKDGKTTITNTSCGSYAYNKSYSADKRRATLGKGSIALKYQRNDLGNRVVERSSVHLGSSSAQTNIDSTTIKAVINPVKTAKHFIKDINTIKDVTVATGKTILSAKSLGSVEATLSELTSNALDGYDANIIGKDKDLLEQLDKVATQNVDAAQADGILNALETKTTTFGRAARVTAYRGGDASLSDAVAAGSNAFYSKSQDKKFINISGPAIKGAADLFGALKHEEQRRVNERKPRLAKLPEYKKQLLTDRRRKRAITFATNQGFSSRAIKLDRSTPNQRASFRNNNALAGGVKNNDAEQWFFVPSVINSSLAVFSGYQIGKTVKDILNDKNIQDCLEKGDVITAVSHAVEHLPGFRYIGDAARQFVYEQYLEGVKDLLVGAGTIVATEKGGKILEKGLKKLITKLPKNAIKQLKNKFLNKQGGGIIDKSVLSKFKNHAFAKNRHTDLGLSVEVITSKSYRLIEKNIPLLKAGDNTLLVKINGIQKSFKVFVQDGKVINMNMYSGVSNRITKGPLINLGDIKW